MLVQNSETLNFCLLFIKLFQELAVDYKSFHKKKWLFQFCKVQPSKIDFLLVLEYVKLLFILIWLI